VTVSVLDDITDVASERILEASNTNIQKLRAHFFYKQLVQWESNKLSK